MRESLADAKVSEEGGGEVLQAPEQKSPAACGEAHGEAGCPPAARGVPRWSGVPRCRARWSRVRERSRRSGGAKVLQSSWTGGTVPAAVSCKQTSVLTQGQSMRNKLVSSTYSVRVPSASPGSLNARQKAAGVSQSHLSWAWGCLSIFRANRALPHWDFLSR